MNEAGFKAKLRAKFKAKQCHIQSMSSPGIGGTPDLWISGQGGDLWLEVKYDQKTKNAIRPNLSALQRKWLDDRYKEGRQVAVLVGTAPGVGILYQNLTWADQSNDRRPLDDIIQELTKGLI